MHVVKEIPLPFFTDWFYKEIPLPFFIDWFHQVNTFFYWLPGLTELPTPPPNFSDAGLELVLSLLLSLQWGPQLVCLLSGVQVGVDSIWSLVIGTASSSLFSCVALHSECTVGYLVSAPITQCAKGCGRSLREFLPSHWMGPRWAEVAKDHGWERLEQKSSNFSLSTVKTEVCRPSYRGTDGCTAHQVLGNLDCSITLAGGAIAKCSTLSRYFKSHTWVSSTWALWQWDCSQVVTERGLNWLLGASGSLGLKMELPLAGSLRCQIWPWEGLSWI